MNHYEPEQLSLYVDGELDAAERRRVEEHVARCEACRRTRDEFLAVRERVRADAPTPDRVAQQRALKDILTRPATPLWRRPIAVPAPVLAGLVVALVIAAVALVTTRPERGVPAPPVATEPSSAGLDPSRFDRGNRVEIYVARRGQEQR